MLTVYPSETDIPAKIMMLPVILLCAVMLASAQHTHKDVGDYGYYNTWRKAVCEKNDPEMYQEMENCFHKENQAVVDATHECAKVADPASEGKTVDFVNSACKDTVIFKKFDECFEEYEKEEDFRKLMEVTPEIEECYEKIFEKYAMDSLRNYLKDYMDS